MRTGLDMDPPHWLALARRYIGTKEIPGPRHNANVLRWWSAIRAPFTDDETPWCAAFVGGVLEEAGYGSTRSAAAKSYLKFGKPLDRPAVGAVAVLWRGRRDGPYGHVAFVEGVDQMGNFVLLGGNQSNEVNFRPFSPDRVIAWRWPSLYPRADRFDLPLILTDGKRSQNEA